jgi:hypothetical protein
MLPTVCIEQIAGGLNMKKVYAKPTIVKEQKLAAISAATSKTPPV